MLGRRGKTQKNLMAIQLVKIPCVTINRNPVQPDSSNKVLGRSTIASLGVFSPSLNQSP